MTTQITITHRTVIKAPVICHLFSTYLKKLKYYLQQNQKHFRLNFFKSKHLYPDQIKRLLILYIHLLFLNIFIQVKLEMGKIILKVMKMSNLLRRGHEHKLIICIYIIKNAQENCFLDLRYGKIYFMSHFLRINNIVIKLPLNFQYYLLILRRCI